MIEDLIISKIKRNFEDAPHGSGYEFTIADADGRSLVTMSFSLEAKAKAAERAVRAAVAEAEEVFIHC